MRIHIILEDTPQGVAVDIRREKSILVGFGLNKGLTPAGRMAKLVAKYIDSLDQTPGEIIELPAVNAANGRHVPPPPAEPRLMPPPEDKP